MGWVEVETERASEREATRLKRLGPRGDDNGGGRDTVHKLLPLA